MTDLTDLINDNFEKKFKYYYAIGTKLGEVVVEKEGYLKNHHKKFMLSLSKDFSSPQARLEELLNLLLEAEIPAPKLCNLFDADDKIKNQAVYCILNASMKALDDSAFDDLLSLKDAAIMFCKSESALKQAIARGKFQEGVDCKKYGKQWVFKLEALEREYGIENYK